MPKSIKKLLNALFVIEFGGGVMETLGSALRELLDWWGRGEIVKHLYDLGFIRFVDNPMAALILLLTGFVWFFIQDRIPSEGPKLLDEDGSPIQPSRHPALKLVLPGLACGVVLTVGVGIYVYFHSQVGIAALQAQKAIPVAASTTGAVTTTPAQSSNQASSKKATQKTLSTLPEEAKIRADLQKKYGTPVSSCPSGTTIVNVNGTLSATKNSFCGVQTGSEVCLIVNGKMYLNENGLSGLCANMPLSTGPGAPTPAIIGSRIHNDFGDTNVSGFGVGVYIPPPFFISDRDLSLWFEELLKQKVLNQEVVESSLLAKQAELAKVDRGIRPDIVQQLRAVENDPKKLRAFLKEHITAQQ